MHGAPSCPNHRIRSGDTWLKAWIPIILRVADYRAGRLAIVITWDEGTPTSNHIPTVVIAPAVKGVERRTRTPIALPSADRCRSGS